MGSTPARSTSGSTTWDHPHTHGEHHVRAPVADLVAGSSPYAWGALRRRWGQPRTDRIIPIRMGSTRTGLRRALSRWDHPHTHGEHQASSTCALTLGGSSPYAWGALVAAAHSLDEAGIIPIRMGSTVLHQPFNHEFAFFSFSSHPPSRPFKNELEPCTGLCKCLSPA